MRANPPNKPSARLRLTQASPPLPEKQSRKAQYEALSRFYTEEADRYEALNKRASAYLAIVGAISVFAAFKPEVLPAPVLRHPTLLLLAVLALIALLACVAAVAFSLRVTDYRTPIDPRAFVLEADAGAYTEEDSYSVLLAGLVGSIEFNRKKNDERALALRVSLWFASAAVMLVVALNAAILLITL